MSAYRYTVFSGEYPLRHFGSERAARHFAKALRGRVEELSVLKREKAYPWRNLRRWQVRP